jgi:D-alanyl-lipoteichoic acid acyltransferase DltB (MBOAT superfamily)
MFFNSITFLVFFGAVFLLFWLIPANQRRTRNLFILITSYVFYGWWDWRFLSLIALSSAVDFALGRAIHREADEKRRKGLLGVSLAVNLGLLGVFKYFNFFVDSLDAALSMFGASAAGLHLEIVLPVGISFYTFQTLSYTLDIYRRRMEPVDDAVQFFAFVAFFPQLVAGPIERAKDLLPQFGRESLRFDAQAARSGMLLAMWGMFKKVVVADRLAIYVDAAFGAPEGLDGVGAMAGLVFFAGQLYLDFSAYSDIAIGISRMIGFRLTENFKRPYFAASFSDFWKRWHITLSSWFRDYLYIPLGGNRGSARRVAINVMIVFLVSGLWHGASWNFAIWGGLNGLFLIALDPLLTRTLGRAGVLGRWLSAFVVTSFWTLSLAFFRGQTFATATLLLRNLFAGRPEGFEVPAYHESFPWTVTFAMLALLLVVEGFREKWGESVERINAAPRPVRWSMYFALCWVILLFGAHGVEMEDKQFIYFQF